MVEVYLHVKHKQIFILSSIISVDIVFLEYHKNYEVFYNVI